MNTDYWKLVARSGPNYGSGTETYERALPHGVLVRVSSWSSSGLAESIVFVPAPPASEGPYR